MLSGEDIRTLRQERGFTIKQVAGVAGIDHSTLSKYELEKQKLSPETYDRVYLALKMETITEADYLNPNIESFRAEKKRLLSHSRDMIRRGERTEEEHKKLIVDLKQREIVAKNEDYKLNERRKIKAIKDKAQ